MLRSWKFSTWILCSHKNSLRHVTSTCQIIDKILPTDFLFTFIHEATRFILSRKSFQKNSHSALTLKISIFALYFYLCIFFVLNLLPLCLSSISQLFYSFLIFFLLLSTFSFINRDNHDEMKKKKARKKS